jgi:hypothetical protein
MKYIVPIVAIATVLTLGASAPLFAEDENEQTVQMSDLPAAVQTTIKDKAGSNEIEKIEKKTEDGQIVYEAVVNKRMEHRSERAGKIPEGVSGEQREGRARRERRELLMQWVSLPVCA